MTAHSNLLTGYSNPIAATEANTDIVRPSSSEHIGHAVSASGAAVGGARLVIIAVDGRPEPRWFIPFHDAVPTA